MCMNKGTNNACCCLLSIIASLIAAIGIAVVFYSGLITAISTLLYITLVFGVLSLLYLIFAVFCGGRHGCHLIKNSCLATTSIVSIITSVFALTATTLPVASITAGILIGAVAFSFILNLIEIANLFIHKLCGYSCED